MLMVSFCICNYGSWRLSKRTAKPQVLGLPETVMVTHPGHGVTFSLGQSRPFFDRIPLNSKQIFKKQ